MFRTIAYVIICSFQSGEGGSSARVSSRRTGEEPHIGKYRLLKTIGKGNFAKVKLAKHIPTGKEVSSSFIFTSHGGAVISELMQKFPCSLIILYNPIHKLGCNQDY